MSFLMPNKADGSLTNATPPTGYVKLYDVRGSISKELVHNGCEAKLDLIVRDDFAPDTIDVSGTSTPADTQLTKASAKMSGRNAFIVPAQYIILYWFIDESGEVDPDPHWEYIYLGEVWRNEADQEDPPKTGWSTGSLGSPAITLTYDLHTSLRGALSYAEMIEAGHTQLGDDGEIKVFAL